MQLSPDVHVTGSKQSVIAGNIQDRDSAESSPLLSKKNPSAQMASGEIRTYWWRWAILAIFLLNSAVNNAMWITFAPAANVMNCYYNTTKSELNTLSIVNAAVAILITIPSAWMLVRFGLRFTIILGSAATALGGALRLIGVGRCSTLIMYQDKKRNLGTIKVVFIVPL